MNLTILHSKIYEVRGENVILDFDLALLYEVENRALKQSVRRNIYRFPEDFMFQLSKKEWIEVITNCDNLPETLKYSPQTPFAFTEQGVAMLSSVLKSEKAVLVNIAIMRTFVEIRKMISFQSEISQQMLSFKNEIEERLGEHDVQLLEVYTIMEQYLDKKSKQITIKGFKK
jgi:phage regulator Rha-like protein